MKTNAYCIIVSNQELKELKDDKDAECDYVCPFRHTPHCCHNDGNITDFSCWYATVQKGELPKDFFQKVVIII